MEPSTDVDGGLVLLHVVQRRTLDDADSRHHLIALVRCERFALQFLVDHVVVQPDRATCANAPLGGNP